MIAMPNKADAPNPAMTLWLQSKHPWRRVGDLRRGKRIMKLWLLALALAGLTTSCDRHGAISAICRLRDDSPLPSWVVLPAGVARGNVNMTITIYEATTASQWKERFVVVDKRSGRVIQQAIGSGYWHPDSERERAPAGTYPNWVVAEVNGIKDTYEQSERNDLLRIVKK